MSNQPPRSPDNLKERATAQAEAERYLAARAARATPGQAREILVRAGQGNPPLPGDELDLEDGHA